MQMKEMTSKSTETLKLAGLSAEGADVFPSQSPANISDCLRIMQCHAMTNGDTLVN